jgi:hypothetical protein
MKIVTSVVNNPIFIELQYHSLKKFVRGDYEFIIFNDAKNFPDFTNGGNTNIRYDIEKTCEKLNIRCINISNDAHTINKDACQRCGDAMNYMLEYQRNNPDCYLGIDSDMFLINYFNTNRYEEYNAAIVPQYRFKDIDYNYFWNGLYYLNINNISNNRILNWSPIIGICDVGGMMKDWLSIQDDKKIYKINHLWSLMWNENNLPNFIKNDGNLINFFKTDPRNKNNKFYCEIYDELFLHYRAGGNWNNEGINFHFNLSNKLKECLLDIYLN